MARAAGLDFVHVNGARGQFRLPEIMGSGGALLDYDREGDLDIYLVQSGDLDPDAPMPPPGDALYRNELVPTGELRFVNVTQSTGLGDRGYGMGAAVGDVDGDGRPDIYVANDQTPNLLWVNRGEGYFVDEALMAGAAYNAAGAAEASMGVTAGDIDGDGDEDLFMTHLNGESNTLYVNDGRGNFTDASSRAGLAVGSLAYIGFGARFVDLDNDGLLDLFIANGRVTVDSARASAGEDPFAQDDQLFLGRPQGRFLEALAALGPPRVGRGALFGDLDNDGDTDIVVTNNGGPVALLRNDTGAARPWLGARLLDAEDRISVGRLVRLNGDSPGQWRRAGRDGSYLSSNDPRVVLALPDDPPAASVGVLWPDGTGERFDHLAARRWHDLVRGQGGPWSASQ